jgi:hypothetical protein
MSFDFLFYIFFEKSTMDFQKKGQGTIGGNCKSLYVLKEAFTRSRAKRALECGEFIHRFVFLTVETI